MKLTVTGHRPQRIDNHDPDRLIDLAVAMLQHYQPELTYTGMALGWDTAVARACARLGMSFQAVLPHPFQAERWRYADYRMWERLLAESIQPVPVIGRDQRGYKARNRWMVDQLTPENDGLVVSLFDGKQYGGTWYTVRYAQEKGIKVINLWSSWQRHK